MTDGSFLRMKRTSNAGGVRESLRCSHCIAERVALFTASALATASTLRLRYAAQL